MHLFRLRAPLAFLFLAAVASFPAAAQTRFGRYANSLAPYVPSPQPVVERMLTLAHVKPGETVYDLGCGDGRVLITAAQQFKAKAVGVELSESLARKTTSRISKLGLQSQASVIQADLLSVDISPADVVTIYLMTNSNESLRPRLEKLLKPGARVVSHNYPVPGWKPNQVDVTEADSREHSIYLYVMPALKK